MAEEQPTKPTLDDFITEQAKGIAIDETEYERLTNDLSEFEAKINEEAVPWIKESLSDEELEIIELNENVEEVITLILGKRNQFVEEQVEPQKQKLQEFVEALGAKKQDHSYNLIVKEFRDVHPDVDVDALGEFIQRELSPRQKEEIETKAGGDLMQFFEEALILFQGDKKDSKKNKEPEQMPDLDEVPSTSGELNTDITSPSAGLVDELKTRQY